MWGFLAAGLALLVGGPLLAWALSFWNGTAGLVALMVGLAGGFVFTLSGGLHYIVVRQADRDLAAFRRGEYLAHWTYTGDEWPRLIRAEAAAAKRFWWFGPLFIGIFGAVLAFAWPNDIPGRLLAMVVVGAALGAAGCGLAWLDTRRWRRFLRVVQETPPDVYVGPRGLYVNGRYYVFSGRLLVRCILSGERPAAMEFKLNPVARAYRFQVRVPVPGGREEEAEALARHFQ
jgi:hypothetical protein